MKECSIVRRGGFKRSGYLFRLGDECEKLSGGWAKYSGTGSLTNNGSALVLNQPAAPYSSSEGSFRTVNTVDISSASTLSALCDALPSAVAERLKLTVWTSGNVIAAQSSGSTGAMELECDISALTGKHYIGFTFKNYWDGVDAVEISAYINTVRMK